MKMSISRKDLSHYLHRHLTVFYPDGRAVNKKTLEKYVPAALERVERCFSKVNNKYFKESGQTIFNHLNADQYAMFLYLTANTLYREESDLRIASKIFLLNRCLHGVDAFYEVALPEIFLFVHPMGTMIGRAKYSDYFLVYQQCTIGSSKGVYPVLDQYVSLHPGSAIIGNCRVERNCKISAGGVLLDQNLGPDSVYVGNTLKQVIKKSEKRLPIWS